MFWYTRIATWMYTCPQWWGYNQSRWWQYRMHRSWYHFMMPLLISLFVYMYHSFHYYHIFSINLSLFLSAEGFQLQDINPFKSFYLIKLRILKRIIFIIRSFVRFSKTALWVPLYFAGEYERQGGVQFRQTWLWDGPSFPYLVIGS